MPLSTSLINSFSINFTGLSMCVNGWESEYRFSVNSYESEYPKIDESGNIYESGKISSSVNLVSKWSRYGFFPRRGGALRPLDAYTR